MGMGALQVGQRLLWDQAPMKIVRHLDNQDWVLEDLSSGRFFEHSSCALLTAWNAGELRFANDVYVPPHDADVKDLLAAYGDEFRQTYPAELWERARVKLTFVQHLLSAPITETVLRPLIEEIWNDKTRWGKVPRPEKMPGWSTVAYWIMRYRQSGFDARTLIDRFHKRGNHKPRYCEIVIDLIDDLIETRYLTPERPTKQEVLEEIQGRVERENVGRPKSNQLTLPGLATLKLRLGLIPAFDRFAARHGLPAARIRFRNSKSAPVALKPLARVAMDHYRMNLFVVDEQTGLPLGRPWLTLLLDECTRYVVGYHIGFEEPSNVNVARAIRHGIAPKNEVLAAVPGIRNLWDAWGVIEVLVVDNGLEFHGETIEQGCSQYGIKIQYCPRKRPWYKGKVERFFRTLDLGLTFSIPGKTFENLFKREDYDPSKHAVVTLTTLRQIVLKWIVDYYHVKDHRVLQMSPAQAWKETIGRVDRYLPNSSVILDAAFSKSDSRQLTKDGIEHDSLFYQSEDLRRIRQRFGNDIPVDIRAMDDDLGWLMVVVPESQTVVRVEAVNQAYARNLTRWQHQICKRYQRLRLKRDGKKLELLEAKEHIRGLIARDVELMKRNSRQAQKRFMGEDAINAGPSQPAAAATPAVPAPIAAPAASIAPPPPPDVPSQAPANPQHESTQPPRKPAGAATKKRPLYTPTIMTTTQRQENAA